MIRPFRLLTIVCLFFFASLFLVPTEAWALDTIIQYFGLTPSNPYRDTGMDFRIGDYLDIRQGGVSQIYVPGMTQPWIGLPGDQGCIAGSRYTIPGIHCWSLVARVGDGDPFYAGDGIGMYVTTNGHLYLGINHETPFTGTGGWNIRVIKNYNPPPVPPPPFLELPWDYRSKNLTFDKSVLAINSYFDHEYPLLSTSLAEPPEATSSVTNYRGEFRTDYSYSSHDGYDYGLPASVRLEDQVLAAAAGCATFHSNKYGGNIISIDHHNGYQTRYFHLLNKELVTKGTTCVDVTQGQKIGLVGSTGNSSGPHIHFMVIQDKNRDGNFDDNIPDGLTDPFGWQSNAVDPWPGYSYFYNGQQRTGNLSYYLWLHAIPNLNSNLPTNGGYYNFINHQIQVPPGAVEESSIIKFLSAPLHKVSDIIRSIDNTLEINIYNLFGTQIHQLFQPMSLTLNFSNTDITKYKPDTLAIYSSNDGANWNRETTSLDLNAKIATSSVNHLSYFGVFGELKDTTPPTTTDTITEEPSSFQAKLATVTLRADDGIDGSGIAYTMYSINDGGWQDYLEPITFPLNGHYRVKFYSVDNNEFAETQQTINFDVPLDRKAPEVIITVDPKTYSISLTANDIHTVTTNKTSNPKNNTTIYEFKDTSDNTTSATTKTTMGPKGTVFNLERLTFSSNSSTISGKLTTSTSYNAGALIQLIQEWVDSFGNKINLTYESSNNQTTVTTSRPDQTKTKQSYAGLKYLQIKSNQGKLEYIY